MGGKPLGDTILHERKRGTVVSVSRASQPDDPHSWLADVLNEDGNVTYAVDPTQVQAVQPGPRGRIEIDGVEVRGERAPTSAG